VIEVLLARKSQEQPSALLGLSDREREVLQQMATGRNNHTIATTLYMSDRAVEKHIGSIFQKLGLVAEWEQNRRVMAVLAFLEAAALTQAACSISGRCAVCPTRACGSAPYLGPCRRADC
jgi:DNA-binding NarL/FixJ family response regulator